MNKMIFTLSRAACVGLFAASLSCAGRAEPAASPGFTHAPVTYQHIFTGQDGVAHLERLSWNGAAIPSKSYPGALQSFFSAKASKVFLISVKPGIRTPPHNSNGQREFSVILSGSAEIHLSDGSTGHVHAGDIVLIEDRTGPGSSITFGPDGYVAMTTVLTP